jgi:capsid protein
LTLVEEQQNWAGALFDDGEVFILRTLVKNQPRIQTLEGHRCLTPPKSVAGSVYDQIVDGVELDPVTGERLAYWFVDSDVSAFSILARPLLGGTRFIRVDARFVTHIYKCRRPGMLRGIPEGFSALNLLHDFQDLQLMQVKVARRIATIANVVYNNAGEKSFSDLRKSRLGVGTPSTVPQSDMTDRPRYYEQLSGGSTIYARTGEKIEQFPGDRPTVAETGFTDLLLSQICAAYNIPKLMVAPYSLQGTVTRADLDICANGFRTNFEVVKKGLLSIYNWHGEWARNYDRSMDGDFPEDYQKTVVRPPRSPNVDVGRNASALRTELELGTLTYQDVFAERQQDYREQFRQAAESYKFAEDLAKEFGIPVEGIFKKVQFSVGAPSNTSPATVMEGV